jgi:hypothetical protein
MSRVKVIAVQNPLTFLQMKAQGLFPLRRCVRGTLSSHELV